MGDSLFKKRGTGKEEMKEGKQGKRGGKSIFRVLRVILVFLLCVSTVGSAIAGTQTAGLVSDMRDMRSRGISPSGTFERSEDFHRLLDAYMQLFELYMDISSIVVPDGAHGIGQDAVLLKNGSTPGKGDITISELASGEGSGYDYDSYARSYINNFWQYHEEGILLLDLTEKIRSLKSILAVEDGTAYFTPAALRTYSRKERKEIGKLAGKLKKRELYRGTETFLPDIAGGEPKGSEAREIKLLTKKAEAVPQDIYQNWLFQNYPEYAGAYMKTVYADALEHGFKKQDGGLNYRKYRAGFLRDYRATCFLAYDDEFSVEDDEFSMEEADMKVYDRSRKEYAEDLRKSGEAEMEALPAAKKPWNKQVVPCSMEMAQDYARFLVAFYNVLQELFQKSQFIFYYDFGRVTDYSGRSAWKNAIRDMKNGKVVFRQQKPEEGQAEEAAELLFAYYNSNGSVFQTNFPATIYQQEENWKESLKQAGERVGEGGNYVCAVGVDMYKIRLAKQTDQMTLLYQKFQEEQAHYVDIRKRFIYMAKLLAGTVFTMLFSFIGLIAVGRRRRNVSGGIVFWHDRLHLEVVLLLGLAAALVFFYSVIWIFYYTGNFSDWAHWPTEEKGVVAVMSLSAMVMLFAVLILAGRCRDGCLLSGSTVYQNIDRWKGFAAWWNRPVAAIGRRIRRFWEYFGELTRGKRYGYAAVAVINGLAGISAAWIILDYCQDDGLIACCLLICALFGIDSIFFLHCLKNAVADERICQGTKRIVQGELSYQIQEVRGAGREQAGLVEAINHIGEGLERAVEESVRNERMKTELITNVSHDIKTPLTSVINYIDLLKREEIENEKAREYLEVLEAKSQRLKVLIEDLVEASKASSGTLELQITTLNFNELLHQTNGEFAEKFQQAGLQLVTDIPRETVSFRGDGRRVYRILENLYGNVAKYAMPGTRVYVELVQESNRAVLNIKNISREQMNITPEELTERFVRGEQSRSTEGSGLGLSIAKSLTELMQGEFSIYLDGDLFRVTVSFPVK